MLSIPVVVDATPEVVWVLRADTVPAVRLVLLAVNRAAVVPSPNSQPVQADVIVVVTLATTPSTRELIGMQPVQTVVVVPPVERATIPPSLDQ